MVRSASTLAFAGAIVVACGGGVSLGTAVTDIGVDGGGSGGGSGDAAKPDCSAPDACGLTPAPQSCGNTGKCVPMGTGCGWEILPCPPTPACFGPDGTLDPLFKKCGSTSDCTVLVYQKDCCGTQHAAGIAIATATEVKTCAADRFGGKPPCACPATATAADDGTIANGTSTATVTCSPIGQCESTFEQAPCASATLPPCGPECTTFPMTGACTTGATCRMKGSKVGDECKCGGGTWTCATHPPLGPGCNLVCN